MHIENLRLNHATNSSSSHSLVFTGKDRLKGRPAMDDFEFGWENFTLADTTSKLNYFAVAVGQELIKCLPREYAELAMSDLGLLLEPAEKGSIDHQSSWTLPRAFGSDAPDWQFVKELKRFVCRDDLAILGGNDNEEPHPLRDRYSGFKLPFTDYYPTVARKDGDYWTLFRPETGAKIRFSFENPAERKIPTDPRTPELVDVKITDFCLQECPFCYQGSSRQGKKDMAVADYKLIGLLAGLRVFEVALGGGEPTMAPGFVPLMKQLRRKGIVPNFSTRSLHWLKDPVSRANILEHCGAFAYSARSAEEIFYYTALVKSLGIKLGRAHIQVILGPAPGMESSGYALERMLTAARSLNVTLLGFKETPHALKGVEEWRIRDWRKRERGWWIKPVKAVGHRVGVDTVLAAEIPEGEFPQLLYRSREGATSCYIDAVEGKVGRSSWEPETFMDFPDEYGERLAGAFTALFHQVRGSVQPVGA